MLYPHAMAQGGIILGDWTHRRGDPGGTRAISADVARARPEVAWVWEPEHEGTVDQVRIVGGCVYVASMLPRDDDAPGWEHPVIYALDAHTGQVVARRALPDPVPVSAMMAGDGVVHVIATRKGEPIFWYTLQAVDLLPGHRRVIELDRDPRHEDVLDAWLSPGGGVWLELESAMGGTRGRAYVFIGDGVTRGTTQTHEDDVASADFGAPARDACCDGHTLFAPLASAWRGEEDGVIDGGTSPALWKIDPKAGSLEGALDDETLAAPARGAWARAELSGPRATLHAIAAEGMVCVIAAAHDTTREGRAVVQALGVDRSSEVVRWKSAVARVPIRASLGHAARVARRPGGEILFQSMRSDGTPCSDLVSARPDGRLESLALGNGKRFLLDAALGELVLAHHEAKNGRVTVCGFEIDREGRLLGRRSVAQWTVETSDLGGSTTVYAGAGHIVVRGARAIAAIRC